MAKIYYLPTVEEMEAAAAQFLRENNFPNVRYHSVRQHELTDHGLHPVIRIFKGVDLVRSYAVCPRRQ